jgi:hypothetical protein
LSEIVGLIDLASSGITPYIGLTELFHDRDFFMDVREGVPARITPDTTHFHSYVNETCRPWDCVTQIKHSEVIIIADITKQMACRSSTQSLHCYVKRSWSFVRDYQSSELIDSLGNHLINCKFAERTLSEYHMTHPTIDGGSRVRCW